MLSGVYQSVIPAVKGTLNSVLLFLFRPAKVWLLTAKFLSLLVLSCVFCLTSPCLGTLAITSLTNDWCQLGLSHLSVCRSIPWEGGYWQLVLLILCWPSVFKVSAEPFVYNLIEFSVTFSLMDMLQLSLPFPLFEKRECLINDKTEFINLFLYD